VRIPVAAEGAERSMASLPPGICLRPGSLTVEFGQAEDLLSKLFVLAQAAAQDFDGFRRMVSS